MRLVELGLRKAGDPCRSRPPRSGIYPGRNIIDPFQKTMMVPCSPLRTWPQAICLPKAKPERRHVFVAESRKEFTPLYGFLLTRLRGSPVAAHGLTPRHNLLLKQVDDVLGDDFVNVHLMLLFLCPLPEGQGALGFGLVPCETSFPPRASTLSGGLRAGRT